MTHILSPEKVLDFWFNNENQKFWFQSTSEFDQLIRDQFMDVYTDLRNKRLEDWLKTADGRLASVIVLDQFTRNMFRDSAQAFETDPQALEIAKLALQWGDDLVFKKNDQTDRQRFLYVPFMHSENLDDQLRCVELYETHGPDISLKFARDHLDVIRRFGRFPGRNKALGRVSTPQEEAFLKAGMGNWGQVKDSK